MTGASDSLSVVVFQEDLSPIPSGQSRLSFLNAVPRGLVSTPQIDGEPLATSLDFGQLSPAAVIEAGAHRFTFASGDTLLASLDSALAAQQNYTLVLTGHTGGGSYRTLLLNTAIVAPSQIRAIHAAPDLGPIAVYLNAQPLATSLAYRAGSDWQTVPARSYDIRVLPADADPQQADSLAETRFNLTSNQAVEILLLEDRGLPALRIFTTDLDPTEPLTARVVAINTAPDTPIAYAQAGDKLIDDIPPVAYGTASRTVDFPAGQINLYWVTGQGANVRVVEPVGDFNFEEGRVYTYVVTGSEYNPFVLVDDVGITQSPEQLATDGLPVAAADQTADLRVINAVTEPLELRVRLDSHTLVNGLENRQASAYQAVTQADYALRIGPASNSANVPDYYIGDLSLLNRDRMSLVAYGVAESMQVSVLPDRVERVEIQPGIAARHLRRPGWRPTFRPDRPTRAGHGYARPPPARRRAAPPSSPAASTPTSWARSIPAEPRNTSGCRSTPTISASRGWSTARWSPSCRASPWAVAPSTIYCCCRAARRANSASS